LSETLTEEQKEIKALKEENAKLKYRIKHLNNTIDEIEGR
jgi:hypothetical protein